MKMSHTTLTHTSTKHTHTHTQFYRSPNLCTEACLVKIDRQAEDTASPIWLPEEGPNQRHLAAPG